MGWIDPTVFSSTPPQALIPFGFLPLWLLLVAGLVVSAVAIVLDRAGALPHRGRRGGPSMTRRVLHTADATSALSGNDGRFLRSIGKG